MRTTLTLDDDVARRIDEIVRRERRTMKDVVNNALRRGLGVTEAIEPYRVPVHRTRLRAGIDPARMNQLADELEDRELIRRSTA